MIKSKPQNILCWLTFILLKLKEVSLDYISHDNDLIVCELISAKIHMIVCEYINTDNVRIEYSVTMTRPLYTTLSFVAIYTTIIVKGDFVYWVKPHTFLFTVLQNMSLFASVAWSAQGQWLTEFILVQHVPLNSTCLGLLVHNRSADHWSHYSKVSYLINESLGIYQP